MKQYTHLIWDFNGTLFDDVDAGIESANLLLEHHGLPLIRSREQYRALFGFPIIDYYRRLGFDFEKTPYPTLAAEWVPYYLSCSAKSKLYADAIATVSAVRAQGIAQLVLSATEQSMLKKQIEELGLSPYLEEILGLDNIHAYSKEEIGICWRTRHPDARVLFVGDTDHDAQVAAAIGADCILVASGHQSRETLQKLHPLAVLNNLSEIEAYLNR